LHLSAQRLLVSPYPRNFELGYRSKMLLINAPSTDSGSVVSTLKLFNIPHRYPDDATARVSLAVTVLTLLTKLVPILVATIIIKLTTLNTLLILFKYFIKYSQLLFM